MVPVSGEKMVVLSSYSWALSTPALAMFTWLVALSSWAWATSRAALNPTKSDSESSLLVEQVQVAFVIRLGLFRVGRGLGQTGHRRVVAGLGLVDRRDVDVRLDFHQQIALVDLLAFLDRQVNDFAADFRADVDLEDGLDLAVGHDEIGEAVARNLGGLHRDGRRGAFQTITTTASAATATTTARKIIQFRDFFFLGVAGRGWSIGGFSTPPECRKHRELSSSNRQLWRHVRRKIAHPGRAPGGR